MFRTIILTILIAGLSFSCKKIDKLTTFKISFNQEVDIPSSTGVSLPFNIATPDMPTNSSATFSANNTRTDLIQEIKVSKMTLSVKSPTGGTFSFLKSVHVYINAQGLSEMELAWKDNVPANIGNELQLDVSGADFKEYIKKEKFSLRVYTQTDEVLNTDYKINVNSQFAVNAKILGI